MQRINNTLNGIAAYVATLTIFFMRVIAACPTLASAFWIDIDVIVNERMTPLAMRQWSTCPSDLEVIELLLSWFVLNWHRPTPMNADAILHSWRASALVVSIH